MSQPPNTTYIKPGWVVPLHSLFVANDPDSHGIPITNMQKILVVTIAGKPQIIGVYWYTLKNQHLEPQRHEDLVQMICLGSIAASFQGWASHGISGFPNQSDIHTIHV